MVFKNDQLKKLFENVGSFSISILFGFIVGGIFLAIYGFNPLTAFSNLFQGSLGDLYGLSETLVNTVPLLLAGLAVMVAFQGSMFNIGVEGQLVIGGLTAAMAGVFLKGIPSWLLVPTCLLAGILGGAAWAFLPGYLKVKRGAHEVITTIMMNYIAFRLTEYLVRPHGPFNGGDTLAASPKIANEAFLPIFLPGTRLHIGILVALLAAGIFWIILWRTRLGYRIRVIGKSTDVAKYAGISVSKHLLITMILSGALAGLAGAIEVIGVHHRFYSAFSPGYGLEGIAIALAGQLHPIGIIAASFVFGSLRAGAVLMQAQSKIPPDVISIITGSITLAVAGKNYIFELFRRLRLKKDVQP